MPATATASKPKKAARTSKAETAAAELLTSLGKPRKARQQPAGPKPGIYRDVPFDEYLSWKYVNNSLIGHGLRSMAHFRAAELQPATESTAAQQFGTLLHSGVLEPSAVADHFIVAPDFAAQVMSERPDCKSPKATNRYKELCSEFEAAHPDKFIVSAEDYDRLSGMLAALCENDRAAEYLDGGESEVSIVWDDPDTGLRCKARLDHWQESECRIVDLKTTRDASDFERALWSYHYYRQAAFYCDGVQTLTGRAHEFCIVALESAEPFAVRSAPIGLSAIDQGQSEYKAILRRVLECRTTGHWPGYADPEEWTLPAWSMRQQPLSLIVDGETVTL